MFWEASTNMTNNSTVTAMENYVIQTTLCNPEEGTLTFDEHPEHSEPMVDFESFLFESETTLPFTSQ